MTREDYKKALIPVIEDRVQIYGRVRILYQQCRKFKGFFSASVLEVAMVDIRHLAAFEKVAVASDVDWIINAVKIIKFANFFPVKTYRNEKLSETRTWITEDLPMILGLILKV